MPETLPGFAAAVKKRCKERRVRQSDLARAIGVTPSSVTNITKGTNLPSLPVYVKLARALGHKERLPFVR